MKKPDRVKCDTPGCKWWVSRVLSEETVRGALARHKSDSHRPPFVLMPPHAAVRASITFAADSWPAVVQKAADWVADMRSDAVRAPTDREGTS